jgi:hypothetical protein
MITEADKQFCPKCQCPREVWWYQYGWLECQVCKEKFQLSDSLRAAQQHALRTVQTVAARLPR